MSQASAGSIRSTPKVRFGIETPHLLARGGIQRHDHVRTIACIDEPADFQRGDLEIIGLGVPEAVGPDRRQTCDIFRSDLSETRKPQTFGSAAVIGPVVSGTCFL